MAIPPTAEECAVPLLGKAEKAQLEELILARLSPLNQDNATDSPQVDAARLLAAYAGAHPHG